MPVLEKTEEGREEVVVRKSLFENKREMQDTFLRSKKEGKEVESYVRDIGHIAAIQV